MVFVVKNMEEVTVEGVNVIQSGELIDDCRELFMEVLLGVFYLSHVELTKARDCIALVHNSWSLTLCAGEDNVNEVFTRGHNSNLLEVVLHHLLYSLETGKTKIR